jgi:hypothetical protein
MPTEILIQIIEWLQLGDAESGSESVQDCRLTCRRLSHIAGSLLITDGILRLSLDRESLSAETVSRNPTIRKTVKTLELNLSLYSDTDGVPLSGFALYAICLLDWALGKYRPDSGELPGQKHWPEGVSGAISRIHDDVGLMHDACHFLRYYLKVPGESVEVEEASLGERGSIQRSKDSEWSEMKPLVQALVN